MMGTIEGCVGVLSDCLPKLGEGVFKEGKEVSWEGGRERGRRSVKCKGWWRSSGREGGGQIEKERHKEEVLLSPHFQLPSCHIYVRWFTPAHRHPRQQAICRP